MSNTNGFPPREIVDQIQKKYPAGTVVVLDHMEDNQAPKEGTPGVVTAVDDIGTIHVDWLTGGGLGVCYGEDSCHIASPRETALYRIGMEAKKQHDGSRCPRCGAPMPGGLYTHALSRRAEIIVCDRCGQEEALEDAASAGLSKAGKPPVQIEDWYIYASMGRRTDMADKSDNKKPFHLIATEVLDDNNNVTGYSIISPEFPSVDAFCERPEDIIQTGWEAKEKAASCEGNGSGNEYRRTNMEDKKLTAQADKYNGKNLLAEEFLAEVLSDKEACQYVLRKLLSVDDLKVTKVVDRVAEKNPQADGEIVDVTGVDGRGHTWEVAVCRTDKVEPLHSRYEFARIVKRLADNGEGYSDTREMAVVYIGAVDHYGKGESIYTVRSYIKEMDKPIDDGTRIIFANSEADDGSEAAAMLQYFKTADAEDESHGELSRRVRQLKLKDAK